MDHDLKYKGCLSPLLHPEQDCIISVVVARFVVLPIMVAPASLSLSTTKASLEAISFRWRACGSLHAAVDVIFIIGYLLTVCRPLGYTFISASIVFAMAMASEFTSIIRV
jgi:hypothetical protein